MRRSVIYMIVLLFVCTVNLFAQVDRLKDLNVKTSDKQRITLGLGTPESYVLIIYTAISDLEIAVETAYDKQPIQDMSYDAKNKRFIIALKPGPLKNNRKYTLILRHPQYHTNDTFQMTIDSFTNKQLILEVDGGPTKEQIQSYWNKSVNEKANQIAEKYIDSIKNHITPRNIKIKNSIGISIGYGGRQYRDRTGFYPWCYIGDNPKSFSSVWSIGGVWNTEFRYGLSIQSGLYTDFALCKYKNISLSDYHMIIPLRVQYRYEIFKDFSIIAFAGPSFDFALAYMIEIKEYSRIDRLDLYKSDNINRFNLLLGAGVGLVWRNLQLAFCSDWGVVNIHKSNNKNYINIPFGINLSYYWSLNK